MLARSRKSITFALANCGMEQWQLVGLITQRASVRVWLPLLEERLRHGLDLSFFVSKKRRYFSRKLHASGKKCKFA